MFRRILGYVLLTSGILGGYSFFNSNRFTFDKVETPKTEKSFGKETDSKEIVEEKIQEKGK